MPIQTKFNIRRKFSQTASETESSTSLRYFVSLMSKIKTSQIKAWKTKALLWFMKTKVFNQLRSKTKKRFKKTNSLANQTSSALISRDWKILRKLTNMLVQPISSKRRTMGSLTIQSVGEDSNWQTTYNIHWFSTI